MAASGRPATPSPALFVGVPSRAFTAAGRASARLSGNNPADKDEILAPGTCAARRNHHV